MVKGISRRVVVVDAPEHRFFEQAIFIVRNDAAGEGITSRELVEEAVQSAERARLLRPTITRPAGPAAFPTGGGP